MKTNLKVFGLGLLLLASCGNQHREEKTLTIDEEWEQMIDSLNTLEGDTTLTMEECNNLSIALLKDAYMRHKTDSMGIEVFRNLCTYISYDEAKALYEEADTLVRNNARVITMMQRVKSLQNMQVGASYIDIEGPNVLTGEALSIKAELAKGKPVLLDFFSSWCRPCKECIKEHLSVYVKEHPGEVNVLGIDVWEKSKNDIDSVMKILPITWPVIYTTAEDSIDMKYGIDGIPTLILLDAEGKIVARGHSMKEVGL